MSEQETLLSIRNLKTYFVTDEAVLKAVDDVSFEVKKGETLGVVGESGCGKSVSCMSIVKLVQGGNVKYEGGQILFEGRDTLQMTEKELRKIRGKDISIIFQEPMTALNPLYTIGDQMKAYDRTGCDNTGADSGSDERAEGGNRKFLYFHHP